MATDPSGLYNPQSDVVGLATSDVKQCSTCLWWRTPRRKRTCKRDRVVKIDGVRCTGAPHTYLCEEYNPRNVAKCGDCLHWTELNRPRKRSPCSELSLTDDEGGPRTADSLYCGYFNQALGWEPVDNFNLRVGGTLVSVVDLHAHSVPQVFLLRQNPASGLLAAWKPTGPGTGSWEVVPVTLGNTEDGELEIVQHVDVEGRGVSSEALFDGTAVLALGRNLTDSIGSQAFRTRDPDGVRSIVRRGLSKIVFEMRTLRKRASGYVLGGEEDASSGVASPPPKRLQDEPWGPDWLDLKEQCLVLLRSGERLSVAVLSVQRNYFRERGLPAADGRRLQAQLIAAFKGK